MNVLGANECARAGGGSRMLLTLWDFVAAQRELSGECLQTHGCNVGDTAGLVPVRFEVSGSKTTLDEQPGFKTPDRRVGRL